MVRMFVIGMLLLCGVGCSTLRGVEPPEVALVNLTAGNMTLFESEGVVQLRVDNANPTPIIVDGGVHRLYIDGVKIGQAMDGSRFEVPRFGSVKFDAPVRLNNLQLARVIKPIIDRGRFDYEVRSMLHLEHEGRQGKLKSSSTGQLDFTALQGVRQGAQPR